MALQFHINARHHLANTWWTPTGARVLMASLVTIAKSTMTNVALSLVRTVARVWTGHIRTLVSALQAGRTQLILIEINLLGVVKTKTVRLTWTSVRVIHATIDLVQ
jgi:hypothetical protein